MSGNALLKCAVPRYKPEFEHDSIKVWALCLKVELVERPWRGLVQSRAPNVPKPCAAREASPGRPADWHAICLLLRGSVTAFDLPSFWPGALGNRPVRSERT